MPDPDNMLDGGRFKLRPEAKERIYRQLFGDDDTGETLSPNQRPRTAPTFGARVAAGVIAAVALLMVVGAGLSLWLMDGPAAPPIDYGPTVTSALTAFNITPTPSFTLPPRPTIPPPPLPDTILTAGESFGRGSVYRIFLSPDGSQLAVALDDGILLYDTEPLNLLWDQPDLMAAHISWQDEATLRVIGGRGDRRAGNQYQVSLADGAILSVTRGYGTGIFTPWSDGVYRLDFDHCDGISRWAISRIEDSEPFQCFPISEGVFITGPPTEGEPTYAYSITWSAEHGVFVEIVGPTIKVWDIETGDQLQQITMDTPVIWGQPVALSPDGQLLAVLHAESVSVWDISTGRAVATYDTPGERVVWQRESSVLAIQSGERVVLWDVRSGEVLHTVQVPGQPSNSYIITDERLYFALPDGVRLYDLEHDTMFWMQQGFSSTQSFQKLEERDGFITLSTGRSVQLWRGGQVQHVIEGARSFDYTSDGRLLTGDFDDGDLTVWATPEQPIQVIEIGTPFELIGWAPGDIAIVSAVGDYYAYDLQTGGVIASLPQAEHGRWAIDPANEGRLYFAAGSALYEWDIRLDEVTKLYDLPGRRSLGAISPDGTKLITRRAFGNPNGEPPLSIIDIGTGDVIATISPGYERFGSPLPGLRATWSPDGEMIAFAAQTDALRVYLVDVSKDEVVAATKPLQTPLFALAFSEDGSTLYTYTDVITSWEVPR